MYRIKSIECVDELNIESSSSWYRYVIYNENNTITGVRSGTKSEVQKHARLCAILLNSKYKKGKEKIYKPVQLNSPAYI
jgi:phosphoserine aminotransferase